MSFAVFVGLLFVALSMPSTSALSTIAQELKWIRQELQKMNGGLPK